MKTKPIVIGGESGQDAIKAKTPLDAKAQDDESLEAAGSRSGSSEGADQTVPQTTSSHRTTHSSASSDEGLAIRAAPVISEVERNEAQAKHKAHLEKRKSVILSGLEKHRSEVLVASANARKTTEAAASKPASRPMVAVDDAQATAARAEAAKQAEARAIEKAARRAKNEQRAARKRQHNLKKVAALTTSMTDIDTPAVDVSDVQPVVGLAGPSEVVQAVTPRSDAGLLDADGTDGAAAQSSAAVTTGEYSYYEYDEEWSSEL